MKIIFPLASRVFVRGCAAHKAAGLGCAVDYQANFVPLYAPVDGEVYLFDEPQGGHWIRITDADGRHWEMAHLSERLVKSGDHVVAGQHISTTGNSGQVTTGPHLHIQLIQGSTRIDPQPLLDNAPFLMAFDTSHIGKEGTLVRIGVSPLRYGYILRGKRFEYSTANHDVLMLLYPFEKFKLIPVINVTPAQWETIPQSVGVQF
jgi:hypothetical protein